MVATGAGAALVSFYVAYHGAFFIATSGYEL